MERELIAERTRRAKARKRENSLPTSHPPLGFRPNGERHHMIPVPEELVIVQEILGLWRGGKSCRAIAANLKQEDVSSKHGARWHHASVARAVGGYLGRLRGIVRARWTRPGGRVRTAPTTLAHPERSATLGAPPAPLTGLRCSAGSDCTHSHPRLPA